MNPELRQQGQLVAGRYRLEHQLGHVDSWLARDRDDSKWVVKFDRPVPTQAVFHPSLVAPEALGDHQLRQWYPTAGTSAPDLAAARRFAEALAALHAAGGAHGNIKSENVLLRDGATPLLVDPLVGASAQAQAADVRAISALFASWEIPDAPGLQALLADGAAGVLDAQALHDGLDDLAIRRVDHDGASSTVAVSDTTDPLQDEARSAWVGRLAIAALVFAFGVLLYVVFGLPGEVATPPPQVVQPEPEPVAEPLPEPPTAQELEVLLAARVRAQEVLDEAINLRLDLKEKQVEIWGSEALTDADAVLTEGDQLFREQRYDEAFDVYSDGRNRMEQLLRDADELVESSLATGQAALDAGDSELATSAFQRAEIVAPSDERVVHGLKRAGTLDQALALRREALAAEDVSQFESALALYRQLRELDPDMQGGEEGIARMVGAIEDRDFRGAMSDGIGAMRIGDLAAARAHLQRAARMRPTDPAPSEHLREVERLHREFEIDSHRVKAEQAVAREDWDQALAHYDACLRRDPNLAFALEGRERAAYRLQLENRVSGLIDEPARWWSDQGRRDVRTTLTEAREVAASTHSVRLGRLVSDLDAALQLASKPVAVTLQSDLCEVVVYRVARLGTAPRTELSLKPGHYTAVGTRNGYRDVRREFTVPAGGPPPVVSLACNESV